MVVCHAILIGGDLVAMEQSAIMRISLRERMISPKVCSSLRLWLRNGSRYSCTYPCYRYPKTLNPQTVNHMYASLKVVGELLYFWRQYRTFVEQNTANRCVKKGIYMYRDDYILGCRFHRFIRVLKLDMWTRIHIFNGRNRGREGVEAVIYKEARQIRDRLPRGLHEVVRLAAQYALKSILSIQWWDISHTERIETTIHMLQITFKCIENHQKRW